MKILRNSENPNIRVIKDPKNIYAYSAFYFENGSWNDAGWAMLDDTRKYIDVIWVKPEFKNKGIGTAIVNFIDSDLGYKIKPDSYKNRTKEGKSFFSKIEKNKKNPSNFKTLEICHGKKHKKEYGENHNSNTLDIRKSVDPDILADITDKDFIKNHQRCKNYYDQIFLVYCPTDIYMTTKEYNKFKVNSRSLPIRQTFENIHFMLKSKGLLNINNFIIACFDMNKINEEEKRYHQIGEWPEEIYNRIRRFVKPISDLFVISDVNTSLILSKVP